METRRSKTLGEVERTADLVLCGLVFRASLLLLLKLETLLQGFYFKSLSRIFFRSPWGGRGRRSNGGQTKTKTGLSSCGRREVDATAETTWNHFIFTLGVSTRERETTLNQPLPRTAQAIRRDLICFSSQKLRDNNSVSY